jgi:hypothetical protein
VMELTHEIQLIDNDEVEHEDVTFQVHLSEQKTDDPGHKVVLGGELQFASCKVQIRDDDRNPGTFRWHSERIEVPESCGHVNVTVLRTGGLSGEVTIQYATKDQTATVRRAPEPDLPHPRLGPPKAWPRIRGAPPSAAHALRRIGCRRRRARTTSPRAAR